MLLGILDERPVSTRVRVRRYPHPLGFGPHAATVKSLCNPFNYGISRGAPDCSVPPQPSYFSAMEDLVRETRALRTACRETRDFARKIRENVVSDREARLRQREKRLAPMGDVAGANGRRG